MALTTYSELQAEVLDYIDDDSKADKVPTFIALAEAEMRRRLRVNDEVRATSSVSSEYVALPDDFGGLRSILVTGTPEYSLEQMPVGEMANRYSGITGTPAAYAIVGSSTPQVQLAPAPSSAVDIEIVYYRTLPSLSDSNTSNWVLASHPDLYLTATLAQAYAFLADEARAGLWLERMGVVLEQVIDDGRKRSVGSAPIYPRVAPRQLRGVRI